ncbi:hypothetical protein [Streptomyces sp. NPDC002845]
MTAQSVAERVLVTHVWVPFRDTSLYVDLPVGTVDTPDQLELLAGAVSHGDISRDSRYGEPMWRLDARDLHAVVEALWTTDHPVHIHLDQAPPAP